MEYKVLKSYLDFYIIEKTNGEIYVYKSPWYYKKIKTIEYGIKWIDNLKCSSKGLDLYWKDLEE